MALLTTGQPRTERAVMRPKYPSRALPLPIRLKASHALTKSVLFKSAWSMEKMSRSIGSWRKRTGNVVSKETKFSTRDLSGGSSAKVSSMKDAFRVEPKKAPREDERFPCVETCYAPFVLSQSENALIVERYPDDAEHVNVALLVGRTRRDWVILGRRTTARTQTRVSSWRDCSTDAW